MSSFSTTIRDLSVEEFDTATLLQNAAGQAKARNYSEIFIMDVDSHHYEDESFSQIAEYLDDPTLRDLALTKAKVRGGRTNFQPSQIGFQDVGGRVTRYSRRKLEKTPPSPHRDITLARRWMNAMGVDMACLFPTPMLHLAMHPQVEMEVTLARAYNRWLCEKILSEERRLCSMLYLPLNDPDAAVRMIAEFGGRTGVVGFMVTSTRFRPVFDNSYMKVYRALEERGLPLAFHAGYNWNDQSMAQLNRFISVHALGFTVTNMIHLTNWIVNGLPERFPKLKVLWIESGLAWLPFIMQRLDNEYMMRTSEAPLLKRRPSEYIADMYFSSQPMEMVHNAKALEVTFEMLRASTQLLYSSDYPHWDMDLPSTIYDLPFLDHEGKKNILGENALRLFNIEPVWSEEKLRARSGQIDGASAQSRNDLVA
jgi:uncharacterized protein